MTKGLLGRGASGLCLLTVMVAGCGDDSSIDLPDAMEQQDAGPGPEDSGGPGVDTGIGGAELLVGRMAPDHGPFTGGNEAVVRGTGFTADAEVEIGGRLVQPADTDLVDGNRLRIVLPAGEPGPADVTVRVGGQEATLPDGYTYDAVEITPNRGAVSGGTLVTFDAATPLFEPGDGAVFGPGDCTDVTIVSTTRMTCRTPPGAPGPVDVHVMDVSAGTEIVLPDGFTYYDSADPFGGGLGGGPITGSVNLTVLNITTGEPVADAFAIIGEDLGTPHQGLTNLLGQISFSGDDLIGPQTIHVAKFCFEKTSYHAFDASEVTVFLIPWMDPRCGMGPPMFPPSRPRNGAYISGELIWYGPAEHGPNPWANIPDPRENEIKVAYVYTTQACPGADPDCQNPDPALGGGVSRVLETPLGTLGYPYRIFARPAALAVYSLAGLENTETRVFTPYVMGVARNVLAGPGEEVEGVDVVMNIPLDHSLSVRLTDLPMALATGPDRFRVSADIDLGGEGVITRQVNGEFVDILRQRSAERPFRFWAQPALLGTLEDGRYRIESSWHTGDFENMPLTVIVENGVRDVAADVTLDGWLGIPVPTAPAAGEALPADRMLRWTADGDTPSFHVIVMIGSDGNPAWRHFGPGDVREAAIPDLSTIPEIDDIPTGFITWAIFAVRIPAFDFDTFSYYHLNQLLWSGWAQDVYTARR